MRAVWHDVWGCAKGPVASLAPHVRIAGGAGVFATCMVAPTSALAGGVLSATAAGLWLCACWPPPRLVRRAVVLGLAMLLPYAVLMALFSPKRGGAAAPDETLAIIAGLFVRGMSGLVAAFSTISTLSASDLREGLVRLPVPTAVSAILLQIVHQTAVLAYETKQVASAMSVRAASGGRITLWRVLFSLPQVWLPRVVQRADRVAAAMEVRGFCAGTLETRAPVRARLADWLAMALVTGSLVFALVVRWSVR